MRARITRFKMKPDSTAEARALMERLRGDIMDLPGMRQCLIAMNDDGTGQVIALIDAAGTSPEAIDRVRAIWHKFQEQLETMPAPEIFEVIADWRSGG